MEALEIKNFINSLPENNYFLIISGIASINSLIISLLIFFQNKNIKKIIEADREKIRNIQGLLPMIFKLRSIIEELDSLKNSIREHGDMEIFEKALLTFSSIESVTESLEKSNQIILGITTGEMENKLNLAIYHHDGGDYERAKDFYIQHLNDLNTKELNSSPLSIDERDEQKTCYSQIINCCIEDRKREQGIQYKNKMKNKGIPYEQITHEYLKNPVIMFVTHILVLSKNCIIKVSSPIHLNKQKNETTP